jgi:hypothetical protein
MTFSAAMVVTSFYRAAMLSVLTVSPLLASRVVRAENFYLESAGARFGFSAESRSENFHQAEGFVNCDLPWYWEFGSNWRLQSRLDSAAGWLGRRGEDAFVGSVGPSLVLSLANVPVSLSGGSSPTFISEHEFGPTDLGSLFQFTSHAGLNWDIGSHLQLGYRFQHMSNAGISKHNPGLNLHMFGISYRF